MMLLIRISVQLSVEIIGHVQLDCFDRAVTLSVHYAIKRGLSFQKHFVCFNKSL